MRVLIASPPKTGNIWLKNILASLYELEVILNDVPSCPEGIEPFIQFYYGGKFPIGSILHEHYRYSTDLEEFLRRRRIHIFTTLRDPYDTFVSLFFFVQNFADEFRRMNDIRVPLIGHDIGDQEVLDYLDKEFGSVLDLGVDWMRSGRSIIVRYEDLHRDPVAAIEHATASFHPRERKYVEDAIQAASAAVVRNQSAEARKHIRTATVGDWEEHLSDAHFRIFREKHGERIRALGYQIR